MNLLLLVVVLMIVIILWRYQARTRRKIGQSSNASGSNDYHCVTLKSHRDACQSAKQLEGKRLLSTEAPGFLPLPECDAADCRCRYKHYEDRRQSDRRDPHGLLVAQNAHSGVRSQASYSHTLERRTHSSDRRNIQHEYYSSLINRVQYLWIERGVNG